MLTLSLSAQSAWIFIMTGIFAVIVVYLCAVILVYLCVRAYIVIRRSIPKNDLKDIFKMPQYLYDIVKKHNIDFRNIEEVRAYISRWKTNELGLAKDNAATQYDEDYIEAVTRVIIVHDIEKSYNVAYVFFGDYFAYKVKADQVFMHDLNNENLKCVDDSISEYTHIADNNE